MQTERPMDIDTPTASTTIPEETLSVCSASTNPLCVDRTWLEKVIARLSRELELAEEFSRKPIPEPAQRMYVGRASALRFTLGLLDESLDPLAFLKQPIPDRHWPPSFRFRRPVASDCDGQESTAEASPNLQANISTGVSNAASFSENSNGSSKLSPECP